MKLVVFDCDGTLVDSAHTIVAAMTTAFVDNGLGAPDGEAVRRIIGLSLDQAVASLMDGAAGIPIEAVVASYKHAFAEAISRPDYRDALFPGARDALAALESAGYVLGIATGKSRRGLHGVLDKHGLRGRFGTLQTADDGPSKPHPGMLERAMAETGTAPAETVMVGDTTFDMEMARTAGAIGIGVSWGYHPRDHLASAGAAHTLDRFDELAPLLADWADGAADDRAAR